MAKKEDELNFETDNNKMASSEKLKALQAAMDKIEKCFGKGSIMKMGDDSVCTVRIRSVRIGQQGTVLVGQQETRNDGVYTEFRTEFGG